MLCVFFGIVLHHIGLALFIFDFFPRYTVDFDSNSKKSTVPV